MLSQVTANSTLTVIYGGVFHSEHAWVSIRFKARNLPPKGLQKVTARLEASKPTQQMVNNP